MTDGSTLAPIGYALSALALLAAAWLVVDAVRRGGSFPALEHGAVALSGRAMRWLWIALIVLSPALGPSALVTGHAEKSGPPGLVVVMGEPIAYEPGDGSVEMATSSSRTISLPFYRTSTWSGEARDGQRLEASTESIVLPLGFLLVVLAYLWAVIRKSPDAAANRGGIQRARALKVSHRSGSPDS
jgi:hypothetical protein